MTKKASSKAKRSKKRSSSKPRELTPAQRRERAAKGWATRRAAAALKNADKKLQGLVMTNGTTGWKAQPVERAMMQEAIRTSLSASAGAEQGISANAPPNTNRFRHVDFETHRVKIERAVAEGGKDLTEVMHEIAMDGVLVGQNEAARNTRNLNDLTIVQGFCDEIKAHRNSPGAGRVWTLADYVVQALARVLTKPMPGQAQATVR